MVSILGYSGLEAPKGNISVFLEIFPLKKFYRMFFGVHEMVSGRAKSTTLHSSVSSETVAEAEPALAVSAALSSIVHWCSTDLAAQCSSMVLWAHWLGKDLTLAPSHRWGYWMWWLWGQKGHREREDKACWPGRGSTVTSRGNLLPLLLGLQSMPGAWGLSRVTRGDGVCCNKDSEHPKTGLWATQGGFHSHEGRCSSY